MLPLKNLQGRLAKLQPILHIAMKIGLYHHLKRRSAYSL